MYDKLLKYMRIYVEEEETQNEFLAIFLMHIFTYTHAYPVLALSKYCMVITFKWASLHMKIYEISLPTIKFNYSFKDISQTRDIKDNKYMYIWFNSIVKKIFFILLSWI